MPEKSRLILRARPDTEAARILESLQEIAAGTDDAVDLRVCHDPDMAQGLLRPDDAAILCQIYTAPERALCRAIQQEQDPDDALADWADDAREILALHRRNRRRSLLFEAAHLCRYSDTGLARLGLSSGSRILSGALGDPPMSDPVLDLVVQFHLQARSDVRELREELDASAQLLSNDAVLAPPLSAELALHTYRTQKERLVRAEQDRDTASSQAQMMTARLEGLETDLEAKQTGLDAQQEKIDRITTERDTLDAQVAEKEKAVESRQARLDHMLAERTRLRASLEAKEAALGMKQAEIAGLLSEQKDALGERDARITDLARSLRGAQEHAQTLEDEIARIMNSRSMRMMAPLRRFAGLFRRTPND